VSEKKGLVLEESRLREPLREAINL